MTIRPFLFALFSCCVMNVAAQGTDDSERSVYEQAETHYNIGRVEQCRQLLTDQLGRFSSETRVYAYRLLSLCCLEMGNDEEAKRYVQLILRENPFFRANDRDPQRFKDMLVQGNVETATISTASSKEEALSEVPVPVTLITEEMIRISGARNLKDVLLAYVPGMNDVDCNDDINIAMRGVFSSGQEKILIMLDGHRLNSFSTSIAAPDFSISLEKVKQIEVLRGPASSLYGGVALSAVVNIITKQGGDVDGVRLKGGAGNFGQLRGDVLFGKHYADLDVLFWGSLYRSEGQKRYVPIEDTGLKLRGGDVVVGGVGEKPSYDMGMRLTWKNRLKFMYNTRFSQIISPFTASYGYSPYDRNEYMTFNGIKPSFATRSHHIDLNYSKNIGSVLNIQADVTYDNSDLTHYQVISDSSVTNSSRLLGFPQQLDESFGLHKGLFRYINGQEGNIGARIRGDLSYNQGSEKKEGTITFGAQFNHFELEDVRYVIGLDYQSTFLETNDISQMGKGFENSFNTFLQLKQHWHDFILNAGVRFDNYRHYDRRSINELSPRVALIYVQPKWNAKLGYSKSFVCAPYFYRKTNNYINGMLSKGVGEENTQPENDLNSEYLHSFQLTLAGTKWIEGLDLELNGYYNRATSLIYTSIITHKNAGTIKTLGAEFSGSYRRSRLSTHLTMAWQHVIKSEIYQRNLDKAYNIPDFTMNVVVGWNVTDKLLLHSHVSYETATENYVVDLANQQLFDQSVSPKALVDFGARYSLGAIELGATCHNLLNHYYYRGGIGTGLIPQQGRSFLFYLATRF